MKNQDTTKRGASVGVFYFIIFACVILLYAFIWALVNPKIVKVQQLPIYKVRPNYVIELVSDGIVKIQTNDSIYTVPLDSIVSVINKDNL